MVVFYEARALFDYEPVASDELRLRVGDLIEVRIGGDGPQEEGWLFGSDQRGCHGSFPANYVAEVRGSVSADNADDPDDHGHESGDVHAALSYANQDGSAPTGIIGTPTALPKGEVNMNAQAGEGSQHDSAWVTRDPAQSTSASAVYDEGYRGTNNARCQPSHVATNAAIQESTQAFDAIEGEGGVVACADKLPDGWLSAVDEASGTVYFYTEDGQSSWTRPSAVTVEPLPGVGGEHAPATAAGVGLALGSSSSQEEDRGVKDSAATRIQAVARGKRSRRRMADRQARPKEDSLDGDTNDQLDHAQDVYEDDKAGIGSSLAHEGGLPLTAVKVGGASSSGPLATPLSPDTRVAAQSEGRRRSVEVRINRKAVELIASLVDERIMEEMHRRDSILSEIRESVAILTDRVVAGFPQKGNRRLSPSPSPRRAAREDNSQEDRKPQERKRNTAAPSLRTPKRSPERRSNHHGATASRARGHSPAANNGKGLNQPLSQQQHQRFEAPHQQHTPQRRHSPPAPVDHGSQHPAVPRDDSPFRQRHFHRVEGGTGGAGGGGGDGVQEVRPPDRRSPSPPSPPSRSQPLRALVDCGGSSTAHQDRRPPGKDEPAEDIDDGDDDEGGSTPGFRTPGPGRGRGGPGGDPGRAGRGGQTRGNGWTASDAASPSALPLARANDLERVRRAASEKKKNAKVAETAALIKNGGAYDSRGQLGVQHRGRHGRRALHNPSWYNPSNADRSVPESVLALEYVFGYAGETPEVLGCGEGGNGGGGGGYGRPGGRGGGDFAPGGIGGGRNSATRSTNVVWLRSGEVVFPASAVVIIHDFETNRQRFFTGHDEEVTAVAVHPHHDILVSGQAGKEAIVCLYDATRQRSEEGDMRDGKKPEDALKAPVPTEAAAAAAAAAAPPPQTVFLRELSLGKKEDRGVAALDFSPDGNLLVAMTGGEPQSLSVWDWRGGERLVTARAEYLHLCVNSVRFNPWLYLQGPAAGEVGLTPPGAACYTLVSCGERHVRFWTLRRQRCRGGVAGGGGDAGGRGRGKMCGGRGWGSENTAGNRRGGGGYGEGAGWEWGLISRPGHFGMRGEIESMTCMTFIGEPLEGREERQRIRRAAGKGEASRLPTARVITGGGNGQIYFWEVAEEGRDLREQQQHHHHHHHQQQQQQQQQQKTSPWRGGGASAAAPVGWQPRGRLLAAIPKAHDGPITDMSYLPHGEDGRPPPPAETPSEPVHNQPFQEEAGGKGEGGAPELGRLATCGGDGTLRLWGVTGEGPSPLQLYLTVDVSSRGVGIGHPRSVSWDRSGTTLAIGTVGNAVCLVQPGEDTGVKPDGRRSTGSVMFMLTAQGHTGSCKALAPHPKRPWFVTGGTDSVLRLWDARSRRQLSAARLLETVCSAAFHPTGDVIAVGNEAGEFLLMALRTPPPPASATANHEQHRHQPRSREPERNAATPGFSWDVLARKRIPVGGVGGYGHRHGNGSGSGSNSAASERSTDAHEIAVKPASFHSDGGAANSPVHAGNTVGVGCEGSSLSPPRPPRGSKDGFPSPHYHHHHHVSPGVAAPAAAAVPPAAKATTPVSVLRFSPDGRVLAAACGIVIHLFYEAAAPGEQLAAAAAVTDAPGSILNAYASDDSSNVSSGMGAYRRYAACKGHARKVRSFDFSRDGSVLQSNDVLGELLFWDVSAGNQLTDSFGLREVEMHSWSCLEGWATQGLGGGSNGVSERGGAGGGSNAGGGPAGEPLVVCRSNEEDVIAAGNGNSCVSLLRNPAPVGAKARVNWGHTSVGGVSGLAFLCDDRRLISIGGTCVFVWRHVRRPSLQGSTEQQ